MKIVYCINIHSSERISKIKKNIEIINKNFSKPHIYVASNGPDNLDLELSENVFFKKWGLNQGWQLGALNGCFQSLKFASENINGSNGGVIFSHEDIYPVNKDKVFLLLEKLSVFDVVCRRYVGNNPACRHSVDENYPYCMIECMLFSSRVIEKFKYLEPIKHLHDFKCAEEMMGYFLKTNNFKCFFVDFVNNVCNEENEMGFYHDHIR